jgi:uncharacterized membrane protein YhaH (DUF805 family)
MGKGLWFIFTHVVSPSLGLWETPDYSTHDEFLRYNAHQGAIMSLWYAAFALVSLPFLSAAFAITLKRFHDLNKAGWWFLVLITPIVAQLLIIMVFPGWAESMVLLLILGLAKYGGIIINIILFGELAFAKGPSEKKDSARELLLCKSRENHKTGHMNDDSQDHQERRSRGLVWVCLCWLAVILVPYVLSSGPVAMMEANRRIIYGSPMHTLLSIVYFPLWWAYIHTPLGKPLGMYWHLWASILY